MVIASFKDGSVNLHVWVSLCSAMSALSLHLSLCDMKLPESVPFLTYKNCVSNGSSLCLDPYHAPLHTGVHTHVYLYSYLSVAISCVCGHPALLGLLFLTKEHRLL